MNPQKINQKLNNQDGFVLVLSMLIMIVLLVIGVTSMKTSKTELYIAGNEKVANQNFYSAESGAFQAAQEIENDNATALQSWSTPGLSSEAVMENIDLSSSTNWDDCGTIYHDNSTMTNTKFISIDKGVASGNSLDQETSQVHSFDIYGRTDNQDGLSTVNIGYKKRY